MKMDYVSSSEYLAFKVKTRFTKKINEENSSHGIFFKKETVNLTKPVKKETSVKSYRSSRIMVSRTITNNLVCQTAVSVLNSEGNKAAEKWNCFYVNVFNCFQHFSTYSTTQND